jgi:hypothetical protein
MEKKHVQRLKRKHRFLMYLLKKVGNRTTGMGFKIMKFHAILHLAFDILMFSVPMVVDTGSNESHHKTTKVAAKLTQKDIKTFEQQTSNRMDDFHVLDLAMEEIDGRPLWEYYSGYYHDDEEPEKESFAHTGGMMFHVLEVNEDNGLVVGRLATRMNKKHSLFFEQGLVDYARAIQEDVAEYVPKMMICAEHSRGGQMFRSHPNYRGKGPWRDWVMIAWDSGDYPAHIWGFIDLSEIPVEVAIDLRNGKTVERGVYAIVESCEYFEEETPESDIFRPLILETNSLTMDGDVYERKYYLVDVEAFKQPIVVIPDIGAQPKCRYLLMAPRSQWADDFIAWIEMDHDIDEEEMVELPAPLPMEEKGEEEEENLGWEE